MAKTKLTKSLRIRLDDELDTLLSSKANQANLTKSDYIRSLIIDSKIDCKKSKKDDYFSSLIIHFSKIGNNLNQLTRALNIANKKDELNNYDFELLLDELAMINNQLNEIKKELK
jgi:hypothetical protein